MKFIQSTQNPQVKTWKKLTTKKGRDSAGLFLIEGFHLVEEAAKAGVIEEVMVQEGVEIPDAIVQDVTLITKEVALVLAETEHTQGIFAVCSQPEAVLPEKAERLLLIDAVQDPGNVGTMIRTADAAGIDAVILGRGTVDPYSAKVLRSAQGSHFHLPIIKMGIEEIIEPLKERGVSIYGTALEGAAPYKETSPGQPFALIMGNEGAGVSPNLLEVTDRNLYVPIHGKSESLNVAVAAGVLLYHLT